MPEMQRNCHVKHPAICVGDIQSVRPQSFESMSTTYSWATAHLEGLALALAAPDAENQGDLDLGQLQEVLGHVDGQLVQERRRDVKAVLRAGLPFRVQGLWHGLGLGL